MLPCVARCDSVSLGFELLSVIRPMAYNSQAIAFKLLSYAVGWISLHPEARVSTHAAK